MGVDTEERAIRRLNVRFASMKTDELMPLPIMLAHKLVEDSRKCAAKDRQFSPADGKSSGNG